MELLSKSIHGDDLRGKVIDRWDYEGPHLVIVFTDKSWCLIQSGESEIEGVVPNVNNTEYLRIPESRLRSLGILSSPESAVVTKLKELRALIDQEIAEAEAEGL